MSRNNLTTKARYQALNPDDLKITHIQKLKLPRFIDVTTFTGSVVEYVNYYFDEENDVYYVVISADMFKRGVRLPEMGTLINLCDPVELVMKGFADCNKTKAVISTVIMKSKNFRTAKVNITSV
jgi:hypothetical protein